MNKKAILLAIESIVSIFRVIKYSRKPCDIPGIRKLSKTCFVLGNGPSLIEDLKLDFRLFSLYDTFCVNQFAESGLYEKIRPKYYVLADPVYWESDVSEDILADRCRLIDSLQEKTNWPLVLLLPFQAKEEFKKYFKENKNICIVHYNVIPLSGFNVLVHRLFKLGLGMPPAQNVLIPTLFYAIQYGYKEIILLGADHSWHETIMLDEENRVCMKDNHFYNRNSRLIPWSKGKNDGELFTMDSLFHSLANMFSGYCRIKSYAEYQGAEIYNASSVTYIDAFKRIPFSEFAKRLYLSKYKNTRYK